MGLNSALSTCSLCHSKAIWFCDFFKSPVNFYKCSNCNSIFKESNSFLNHIDEKVRYKTHNNDVEDIRYQQFVSPITEAIQKKFSNNTIGLDYGCGPGPVATYVLEKKGYKLTLYDPFFYNDNAYKKTQYDFIICCEVMEHFHQPDKEFEHLKNLLRNDGVLYCKTKMISDNISVKDFKAWHYKDDPTHVFFYTPRALYYIKSKEGFKSLYFDDKLIIFNT